jgi:hypothetical protein
VKILKINDLLENFNFKLIAGTNLDKIISGVYSSDLLSWVMSHAKAGDAWLTVQTHNNVLAIATLLELACVIIVEDAPIDEMTIKKANEENLILLTTHLNAYEVMKIFCKAGY